MLEAHAQNGSAALNPFRPHPNRQMLLNEAHARPPVPMRAPLAISHVGLFMGEVSPNNDLERVIALCEQLGCSPPAPDAKHFFGDLGTFKLKYERHTEFATFTFLRPLGEGGWFQEPALSAVPVDWLQSLPGELLAGVHVAMLPATEQDPDRQKLKSIFGSSAFVGSEVARGSARAWTDFRTHQDGFGRLVVRNLGMNDYEAGRVVQWFLEIETYRLMALLALPVTREVAPKMAACEITLTDLTKRLTEEAGFEEEREILNALTGLSAQNESIASETSYRFAASRAYYELVQKRLSSLEEEPLDGLQNLASFVDKRLTPAASTVEAMARRQAAVAERLSRALSLLRTRVDIALEGQNQDLLENMNSRSEQQLKLQQTVEGLSVVAISYYGLGLINYLFKGAEGAGLINNAALWTGLAIIPFGVFIASGLLAMRKVLKGNA